MVIEVLSYEGSDLERMAAVEPDKPKDVRHPFEVDRARVIHSSAFRKLQRKTQLFAPDQSDHFRTRLTHSLEAAQIAKGIAILLGANTDACEAAALAHDIGHPPFGHKGEEVLQGLMEDYGGFEANAQNLRVLGRLERKFPEPVGLNLTRTVLDAACKYKRAYGPRVDKHFHYAGDPVAEWLKSVGDEHRSFECTIVNIADDIAYAVHDLEDGIHAGLISRGRAERFAIDILGAAHEENDRVQEDDVNWAIEQVDDVLTPASPISQEVAAKQKTSELIHMFIHGLRREERPELSGYGTHRYLFSVEPLEEIALRLAGLKALSFTLLIADYRIHTLEARAEMVLRDLFQYHSRESSLNSYPGDYRDEFAAAKDDESRARIACDYIASMTDERAQRLYRRLFSSERSALLDF